MSSIFRILAPIFVILSQQSFATVAIADESKVYSVKSDKDFLYYELSFSESNVTLKFFIDDQPKAFCSGFYRFEEDQNLFLVSTMMCSRGEGERATEPTQLKLPVNSRDINQLEDTIISTKMPFQFIHPLEWTFSIKR